MYSVSLRRQRNQRSTPEGSGDGQVRKGPRRASESGLSSGAWELGGEGKAGEPRVSLLRTTGPGGRAELSGDQVSRKGLGAAR